MIFLHFHGALIFFLPELEVGVCLAVNYTAANSWSISTFSKLPSLFSEELEHSYKKITQGYCTVSLFRALFLKLLLR